MPHILVVEDDPGVRSALLRALAEREYATSSAATGMAGLEAAVQHRPDLVVVDLGLPDVDGYEVIRMLRAVSAVPVIVATAREDEGEIVRALDAGADDYLVKPFGAGQLDARIRAVLRRSTTRRAEPIMVGRLVVDPEARTANLDGGQLELTPREFDLLCYLAERDYERYRRRPSDTKRGPISLRGKDGGDAEMEGMKRIVEWYEGLDALEVAILEECSLDHVRKARRVFRREESDGTERAGWKGWDDEFRWKVVTEYRQEGYKQFEVAGKLGVSERTIRKYWSAKSVA